MSAKKVDNISPRFEHFVKGVFLILFPLILALNADYVSRTLAFPFIYLFGATYYFVLAYFVFLGVYRIIRQKKFKFKSILQFIGLFLFFLSLVLIIGTVLMNRANISYSENIATLWNNYNAQLSTYYQARYINTYEGSWGSGLFGLLLGALLRHNAASLASGIVILVVAILLLCYPLIYRLVKKKKLEEKLPSKKIEKEDDEEDEDYKDKILEEPEEDKYIYGYEPSEDEPEILEEESPFLDDAFGQKRLDWDKYSDFSHIPFHKEEKQNVSPLRITKPVKVTEPVEVENEEETVPNFEDSYLMDEEVNEELVSIKPTFEEPVAVVRNEAPTLKVEAPKKKERVVWVAPSSDLLDVYETSEARTLNSQTAEERMKVIDQIFQDFGVGAHCEGYTIGSSVTRYNIVCDTNVSVTRIEKMVDDIAIRLKGANARFSRIVEGQPYSGLEIPNAKITTVGFKEVFEALPDVKKHPLAVGFGKNIAGEVIAADFDEFPHLLVAGTTGSGKSIYIHSIIATLIMRMSPDDLKIVLVDPKRVEMTKYRDMPHLLCPIITEAGKAKVMLSKLVDEMNNRYERFADADSCSNIKQFNEYAKEKKVDPMPYILVVLDEYADLVDTCKEISQPVVSIAQKARAAGIHMLISTQRPSTNVITGVIKGNLPTHVALMTSSYTDSMTILGEGGAEKLLGKGDMLVQSPLVSRVGLTRLQGCFIQNKEISRVVGYLKEHYETHYDENYLDLVDHSKEVASQVIASGEVLKEADAAEEAKYQSIKEWVMSQQFVSISRIQRECSVGFNRAGRFFIRMQKEGIVGTDVDGSTKGCKVLVHDDYSDSDMVTSEELIG